MNRVFVSVSLLALWACASDAPAATGPVAAAAGSASPAPASASAPAAVSGTVSSDATWANGTSIASSVEIAPGVKVQIAPGASISVAPAATITVHGTLASDAKASRAKLSGSAWTGLVVDNGGSMTLSGVDLEGAMNPIDVKGGNQSANYEQATISGGVLRVDSGGSLQLDHVAVKQGGYSFVSGTFKATFLDYDGVGIATGDPGASIFVADSKLTGKGADFFTMGGAQLLHVEYTTIDSTHCPFHFNTVSKFEIDHVTTGGMGATSTDAFGLMIYNADVGPHSISYSNFNDPAWDQNRPTPEINVTHTYIHTVNTKAGKVTFMPADGSGNNAQTDMNTDAHPRGTPGPS